jgi:hypothetical protein
MGSCMRAFLTADGLKGSIPNFEAISDHNNPEGALQEAAQAEFNHLAIQVCCARGWASTSSRWMAEKEYAAAHCHLPAALTAARSRGLRSTSSAGGGAGRPVPAGAASAAPTLLGIVPLDLLSTFGCHTVSQHHALLIGLEQCAIWVLFIVQVSSAAKQQQSAT